MNSNTPDNTPHDLLARETLDAATSRRLARLGQRPVDVSHLEQRLAVELGEIDPPSPMARPNTATLRLTPWLRPAAGIAALLTIAVGLFIIVSTSPPTVSAAVLDLSELHTDIMAGRVPMQPVDTIAQANAWIASQQSTGPELPDHLAGAQVQSCCLADVQGDLVAVALLRDGDTTVTLVVAQAANFAHEMGIVIEIDGRRFFGHELNGIRMMMANDGDRWLCVMGDASYEQLAQIAAGVRFGDGQ